MSISLTDDRHRTLTWPRPPTRIVSLVPSDSYTLLRLGAGARLIGRTRYCIEPRAEVERIEPVGGVRDPDLARIVALRPELVLASQEDNRREDVEALEAAGVPVLVANPRTARQGLDHAERLARLIAERDRAARALVRAAHAELERFAARQWTPARVVVVLWPDPVVALGPGTFGSDVLGVVGGDNALARLPPPGDAATRGSPDYPRVTFAELALLEPELVLLPDEPHPFAEADAARLERRWPTPPGRPAPRVRCCDGKDLVWYGLRFVEGLGRLRAIIETRGRPLPHGQGPADELDRRS